MAHEVHHADYREWCAHCVAGKGVSHKHSTPDRETRSDTAEFCLDYAFMTEEGGIGYMEEIDQEYDRTEPGIGGTRSHLRITLGYGRRNQRSE